MLKIYIVGFYRCFLRKLHFTIFYVNFNSNFQYFWAVSRGVIAVCVIEEGGG